MNRGSRDCESILEARLEPKSILASMQGVPSVERILNSGGPDTTDDDLKAVSHS